MSSDTDGPLRDALSSNTSPPPIVSPLRLAKHEPILARRSSSSYKHVHSNNLVSNSPFKALAFPTQRRVSGEKRPRPSSLHDQEEAENARPFALKRERRQSRGFQGLIQNEPVTKSPFRRELAPPVPAKPSLTPSPGRSSLVSRRLHGPRLSSTRRERRKTVTFDERCDVVEFDRDDDMMDDEAVYDSDDQLVRGATGPDSDDEYDEIIDDGGNGIDHDGYEVNYGGRQIAQFTSPDRQQAAHGYDEEPSPSRFVNEAVHPEPDPPSPLHSSPHDSPKHAAPESAQSHDVESCSDASFASIALDPDTSINGLVDALLAPRSTPPPRPPADADTEDGIPYGRSHHRDRERERRASALVHTPLRNEFPVASPVPPAQAHTPPPVPSPATPPLGRTTHAARARAAHHDAVAEAVAQLPPSPSPAKQRPVSSALVPGFVLAPATPRADPMGEDPFAPAPSKTAVSTPSPPPAIGRSPVNLAALARPRITREDMQRRLVRSRSDEAVDDTNLDAAARDSHSGTPVKLEAAAGRSLPDTPVKQEPALRGSIPGTPVKADHVQDHFLTNERKGPEAAEGNETAVTEISDDAEQSVDIHMDADESADAAAPDIHIEVDDANPPDDSISDAADSPASHSRSPSPTPRNEHDGVSVLTELSSVSAEGAVITTAETRDVGAEFGGLHVDFGGRFKVRGLGLGGSITSSTDSRVDVDMRSALDRLVEDVQTTATAAHAPVDATALHAPEPQLKMRTASGSSLPPPVPPKDKIRSREEMILEKRREARRREEMEEMEFRADIPAALALPAARPSRRRSHSTGDVRGDARGGLLADPGGGLLALGAEGAGEGEGLSDSITKELAKLATPTRKSRYLVREREGTIYASASDDAVQHMASAGDVAGGRAWRTVRRTSDMNEFASQIRAFRAQPNTAGRAAGKVFVRVLGVRDLRVPLPSHTTAITCTLNNGIHFVTTPECMLAADCAIEQEFELIESAKLEFTLSLKVRRDPHIVADMKNIAAAVAAPRPVAAPPVPVAPAPKHGGMRGFFSSSPKKAKTSTPPPGPAPRAAPPRAVPDTLGRYLKADGTLARSFVAFRDVAARCDARLLETRVPLVGQRVEAGGRVVPVQVGELALQLFRLPSLPAPEPQSLAECTRGLRHAAWHRAAYHEGTLTQSGGDCSTWRRRRLRVVGAELVAFNEVTRRAAAVIDLRAAAAVEDGAGDLGGVERAFRLKFARGEEIVFFADTDAEKARWLEVLRALVGHIPPRPLWAELLLERQTGR